jgi:hypothetical protein
MRRNSARAPPHSLRRSYISIALLANNFDVKWIMSQVGHADSKMTSTSTPSWSSAWTAHFDGLVRKARDRFAALPQQPTPTIAMSLPRHGHNGEKPTTTVTKRPRRELSRTASLQRKRQMARPGLEPGTPRFPGVRPCR